MPQRISIIGCSGSGKSTLAGELSRLLGLPHQELDALQHGPDWEPAPEEDFAEAVKEVVAGARWVIDGNYTRVQPIIRARADLVIALDLPRYLIMTRLVWRTLKRVVTREELWNGNTERWKNLVDPDPGENIILWGWTQHRSYHERMVAAERDNAKGGPPVLRLTSPSAVRTLTLQLWTGAIA